MPGSNSLRHGNPMFHMALDVLPQGLGFADSCVRGLYIYHHRFASCLSRCPTPEARSGLVNVVYRRASHPGIRLCSAVSTPSVCREAYCHPKHWCVRLECSDCSSSCSMAHSGTSIGLYKKAISAPQDKILLTDCQHVKISVGRFGGQYLYGMVVWRSGRGCFRVRLGQKCGHMHACHHGLPAQKRCVSWQQASRQVDCRPGHDGTNSEGLCAGKNVWCGCRCMQRVWKMANTVPHQQLPEGLFHIRLSA